MIEINLDFCHKLNIISASIRCWDLIYIRKSGVGEGRYDGVFNFLKSDQIETNSCGLTSEENIQIFRQSNFEDKLKFCYRKAC